MMYGLVNKAFVDFVRSKYGDEAWDNVHTASGVKETNFLTMRVYDDQTTYDLVKAASQELKRSGSDILHEFGLHWIGFVRANHLSAPLKLLGVDMHSALRNLDKMHVYLNAAMPRLRPPSFSVETLSDEATLRVHYRSHRPGLAPFVHGLLEGMADMLNQEVEVAIKTGPDDDHEIFDVTLLQGAIV